MKSALEVYVIRPLNLRSIVLSFCWFGLNGSRVKMAFINLSQSFHPFTWACEHLRDAMQSTRPNVFCRFLTRNSNNQNHLCCESARLLWMWWNTSVHAAIYFPLLPFFSSIKSRILPFSHQCHQFHEATSIYLLDTNLYRSVQFPELLYYIVYTWSTTLIHQCVCVCASQARSEQISQRENSQRNCQRSA